MSLKLLTTGVAVAAVVGGAALGVTSVAAGEAVSAPVVQPVVFGVPLPLDPAADVPTADQLAGVLNGLADPGVPFRNKSNLVDGGIGMIEGRAADRALANANASGYLPLSFQFADIHSTGPGTATANVTATGPNGTPRSTNLSFVDQGGWKLSRGSAMTLLQLAS